MSGALRVLVVDDQQLLRRGLVMLFGTVEGVDVVAQAAHGAEALAEAVRAVAAGGLVIDPRVARLALAPSRDERDEGDGPPALALLTPTEREVAALVAEGLSNQAIAARMVLAEGTVKNHVSALLRKLRAADRTVLALTLYKALHSGRDGTGH